MSQNDNYNEFNSKTKNIDITTLEIKKQYNSMKINEIISKMNSFKTTHLVIFA